MQLLYQSQNVEYRDSFGQDQTIGIEIWGSPHSKRVILMLHNLPCNDSHLHSSHTADRFLKSQAEKALYYINCTILPYLLKPDTEILVLALQAKQQGPALVLPLSA